MNEWRAIDQEWEAALAGGKVKGNVSVKASGDSSSAKKKRKVIHENDGSVIRNKQERGKKKKKIRCSNRLLISASSPPSFIKACARLGSSGTGLAPTNPIYHNKMKHTIALAICKNQRWSHLMYPWGRLHPASTARVPRAMREQVASGSSDWRSQKGQRM